MVGFVALVRLVAASPAVRRHHRVRGKADDGRAFFLFLVLSAGFCVGGTRRRRSHVSLIPDTRHKTGCCSTDSQRPHHCCHIANNVEYADCLHFWACPSMSRQNCGHVWAPGRCRISPPRFLAECCKRQLNQGSFVLLYFRLFTFSDLH